MRCQWGLERTSYNAGSCTPGAERGWFCHTRDFPHLAKVPGTVVRKEVGGANPLFRDNGVGGGSPGEVVSVKMKAPEEDGAEG